MANKEPIGEYVPTSSSANKPVTWPAPGKVKKGYVVSVHGRKTTRILGVYEDEEMAGQVADNLYEAMLEADPDFPVRIVMEEVDIFYTEKSKPMGDVYINGSPNTTIPSFTKHWTSAGWSGTMGM